MGADDEKYLTLEAIDEIADWGDDVFAPKSGAISAAERQKLSEIEDGAQVHRAPTASEITAALGYVPISAAQKGAASGLAELDAGGFVPSSQLPSYVDDVLEYDLFASFPAEGEAGKIYIDVSTNITYRWSGSTYTAIGSDVALGETSSTAYRGDRGAAAYAHASDATRAREAKASGLYKIAVTAEGHVASVVEVTASDITGLGLPDATQTASGLMGATDKSNLEALTSWKNGLVEADAESY